MADIDLDMVADMEVDKVPTWVSARGGGGGGGWLDIWSIWPPKNLIFCWVSECSLQEKVKELFPLGGEWGFTYSHIFFGTESENFCWEQNWFLNASLQEEREDMAREGEISSLRDGRKRM